MRPASGAGDPECLASGVPRGPSGPWDLASPQVDGSNGVGSGLTLKGGDPRVSQGKKGKKGKKKSKAELEEEARLAEEERLREEEERKRLEEEERKRREEEAARLAAEKAERLRVEGLRLAEEQAALAALYGGMAAEREKFFEERGKALEWETFLECSARPNPQSVAEMNDFFKRFESMEIESLPGTLQLVRDVEIIKEEASKLLLYAKESGETDFSHFNGEILRLRELLTRMLDQVTAYLLQRAEDFTQEDSQVQVCEQLEHLKLGLWVNIKKNHKLKAIEMPGIGVHADVPKAIALVSAALRLIHLPYDHLSKNEKGPLKALGGIFTAELLTIPPAPKTIKQWTMRHVTELTTNVQKLPYPIPPAGADPLTYRAELMKNGEPVPPITFTYKLPESILVLEDAPSVGWWDAGEEMWKTEGITDVKYSPADSTLTYTTTYLESLALLQSSVFLMPYKSWFIRPTGTPKGATFELSLSVSNFSERFVFEVGEGTVALKGPAKKQLEPLLGQPMSAGVLLYNLQQIGVNLVPQAADAAYAGVAPKDAAVEKLMCADLATLAPSYLIASSKWNAGATAAIPEDDGDCCVCRVSEIKDFERTLLSDAELIFSKEKVEPTSYGSGNVFSLLRIKKGITFVDALDKHEGYQGLPDPAVGLDVYGMYHHDPLTLLDAAGKDLAYPNRALPATLDRCKKSSPLLSHSLAGLMSTLRLFSFSK